MVDGLSTQGIGLRPQPWAPLCRPVGPVGKQRIGFVVACGAIFGSSGADVPPAASGGSKMNESVVNVSEPARRFGARTALASVSLSMARGAAQQRGYWLLRKP